MKVDLNPKTVTERIDRWLRIERWRTYNGGHNNLLDNYETYRKLYLPNTRGDYINKVSGHHSRFKRVMDMMSPEYDFGLAAPYHEFAAPYDNDLQVAKIGHHSLMFVSGAKRAWANALSTDQWWYDRIHIGASSPLTRPLIRHRPPTSINILEAVEKGFAKAREFERGEEVDGIRDYGYRTNNDINAAFGRAQEALTESDAQPGVAVPFGHPFLLEMDDVQRDAIALTAAHFAVAAWLRQDAGHDAEHKLVPILQPDSVSVVANMELIDILSPTRPLYTFKEVPM